MNGVAPRRGDVWLAHLDKVRPLIVLTRNPLAGLLHAVIAAPVTSTVRGLSTEVEVGPADGVHKASVANLDNVQLVERGRLIRKVGRAQASTMRAICTALDVAVSCDRFE